MAAAPANINRKPGPQKPEKYPYVGSNYLMWGEQPGMVYWYPEDTYYQDPNAIKGYMESSGLATPEPEKPSMTDTLGPLALLTGGMAIASEGGKAIVPEIGAGLKKAGGLLGMGGTGATTTASTGAGATGATGAGLLGAPEVLGAERVGSTAALPATETSMLASYGVPAAVALGTFLGGRAGLRMAQGKMPAWGKASLADKAGRGLLGVATGGLSEVANKLFGGHKSTAQVRAGNTKELQQTAPEDAAWQSIISAVRGPRDPSQKKAFGEYDTFEEARKAGLDPNGLMHVYGNLSTFGPDWAKYTQDQRYAITKALIDADQYYSKKGEVLVRDKELAKKLAADVLAGNAPAPATPATAPQTAPQTAGLLKGAMTSGPATLTPEEQAKLRKQQILGLLG